MNLKSIPNLQAGDILTLKPERAAAYGKESRQVTFIETQRRFDYKVGFIVGRDASGEAGHYRPSDFTSEIKHPTPN